MPKSALPEGFQEQAAGTGTDWDNWFQKYWRKDWFAYGPRATERWARWRELPVVLFKVKGQGDWRYEASDGSWQDKGPHMFGYLSAIQYWTKWHFAILWPLEIQMHYYVDEMPTYPEKAGNKRVFYFRIGARRDADKVYWFPSLFVGLQWN